MFGQAEQSGTHTTTTRRELPNFLEQPLQQGVGGAQNLYQNWQSNPNTVAGLQNMLGIAGDPNQYGYQNALQHFSDTLGGDYLYGNPGFNAAYQAAADQIIPQVQGAFSSAGRLNSGGAQSEMARQLGNAFASQYGQERNRMVQMQGLSPTMQQFALGPGQTQYDVGQLYDQETESNLDDYLRRIQGAGNLYATETSEQPLYENDLAQLLGLLSTGTGIAQSLFGEGGLLSGGEGGGLGGALSGLGSTVGDAYGYLTGSPGASDVIGGLDPSSLGSGIDSVGGEYGSAGGGLSLPSTPPGAGQVAETFPAGQAPPGGSLTGLSDFAGFASGLSPAALGSGIGSVGGAYGALNTAALAGAPSSFSAFAPGIGGALGSGVGTGSAAGAAAAAPAAAGGAAGGLGFGGLGLGGSLAALGIVAPTVLGVANKIFGGPSDSQQRSKAYDRLFDQFNDSKNAQGIGTIDGLRVTSVNRPGGTLFRLVDKPGYVYQINDKTLQGEIVKENKSYAHIASKMQENQEKKKQESLTKARTRNPLSNQDETSPITDERGFFGWEAGS